MLHAKHIHRRFERAASSFDSADFVHTATREGLLARLHPLLVDAKTVLDLGCATGAATRPLNKRFPQARVVAVDIAHNMLLKARTRKHWFSKSSFAQADATALPFADQSIDVVFSNQLLPWITNPDTVFTEIARILKEGGVFAFATLGPDSLTEISRAWREVDVDEHVSRFPDMHNLGDGLVNAGLRDPVLDVDRLTVRYRSHDALFADLTAVGARNALAARRQGLTGRGRFSAMLSAFDAAAGSGNISLDLELVFGHCFGAGARRDPTNYRIDANQIPVRHR